ncbi:MAG: hypothetical protein AAFV95_06365 [Bacteroidota bacterium]
MKNFTGFKYQKSVLRTVEEPPVKKKFNWDRFLFILTILAIIIYMSSKFYRRVAFVSVSGQVLVEKLQVHFTEDVRIRDIFVEEGQQVDAGDTLFSFRYENREQVESQLRMTISASPNGGNDLRNWFLREKLNVKRQMAIKKSRIEGVRSAIGVKQMELDEQKKQILLGVDVAHKLPPLISEISDYESDIKTIQREIRVLRKHLSMLRSQEKKAIKEREKELKEQLAAESQVYTHFVYYISPINGVIGRIFNSPNEVCYETEDVMTIHQMDKLKIRAYFDQESHREIKIGDEVTINFPDGTIGKGIIHNFYVSTYPLPPEFQSKHEPMERSIVADVLPLNEEEAIHWTGYYKMAVKVIKNKL